MGIRFTCPNGHKLHVKEFLAGKRGICPSCGAKFVIPHAQPAAAKTASVPRPTSVSPPQSREAEPSGSPSIVIEVEPPAPAETHTDLAAGLAPQVPPEAPPVPPEEAAGLPPELPKLDVPDSTAPVEPVSKYIAQRMRNRRNQTTIAIVLLVAVIVLAMILIFVLRQGTASAAAADARRSHNVAATGEPADAVLCHQSPMIFRAAT